MYQPVDRTQSSLNSDTQRYRTNPYREFKEQVGIHIVRDMPCLLE